MNIYDTLYNNINLQKEQFINRKEIRTVISKYYSRFNIDGSDMFNVFSIYGFGGMGKTYLIKHLKNEFLKSLPASSIIHITFEIQENWQMLYSLVKLRKAFNHSCPIFDYALLYYWDLEHIEKLNDDFTKILKNDIISAYTDLGLDFSSSIFNCFIPSFGDLQNVINNLYSKIKSKRVQAILSEIVHMDPHDIYDKLPCFLASDIKVYMQRKNINYIFIFDAYEQSIPYSESAEWLLSFINELQKGLYIITSREKLQWKTDSYKIKEYHLDCYPEDEARDFLKSVIPDSRTDIVDTIISTSGCIPIYVSLAYDLYLKEQNISKNELIKKSKFKDRASLVRHFISHLNQNWQNIIIYLAVIRIFNNDIFDYLIDNLNLPCSKLDFDEIVNVSLFKYIENSNNLYKLHDVFCTNAVSILNTNTITKIFNSYLSYISQRIIYKSLINNTLDSLLTLFTNIIDICIEYSDCIHLNKNMIEKIIDLFLVISDTRIIFPVQSPSKSYPPEINDFLYFMDAIIYEKVNTNDTIYKLQQIKKPDFFGKHFLSYNIVLKYEEALNGNYKPFKEYLENIKTDFTEKDTMEWFYLKTLIYLSDYYMMEGDFFKSLECLENLRKTLSLEIFNTDNYFLIERSIGHIYRFNYDFEMASQKYTNLLAQYKNNPSLKVYLLVNLCETKCFTQPYYVIDKFSEALSYVEQFHNLKNKAKLYYSRGIAYSLIGKYSQALADINTSIKINQSDGYRSGELFAYQAKAFCEYGETGVISNKTTKILNQLVASVGVYDFLMYPIHLINGTENSLKKVNWIDAKNTEKNCKNFLKRLRSKKHFEHRKFVY